MAPFEFVSVVRLSCVELPSLSMPAPGPLLPSCLEGGMQSKRATVNIFDRWWAPIAALSGGTILLVLLMIMLIPERAIESTSTPRSAAPHEAESASPEPHSTHENQVLPIGSANGSVTPLGEQEVEGVEGVVPIVRDSQGRPLPPLIPHQDHVPLDYSPHRSPAPSHQNKP